ncbi:MAG TPA: polysaccharide deacetylase family protein [Elusimicrobiales bacterium]|nr:polysaccharide deacetylase family protein [Elusimicrobiales bacterium]
MFSIPVLMYHHISDDREITLKGFERQLRYLKEQNYYTPSLEEFYLHITGQKLLTKKSVLITFDDGYVNNWICAYPLLKEYEFRAVVFVTTQNIERSLKVIRPTTEDGEKSPDTRTDERGDDKFLSWEELKVMVEDDIFEIGSHTHTHKNFNKTSDYADIERELEISRDLIKKNTNYNPVSIAWPWGHYKKNYIPAAKASGYKLAFTTDGGANTVGINPYKIFRFKMQKDDISWFKIRLKVYQNPILAKIYGSVYGLDAKIKKLVTNLLDLG